MSTKRLRSLIALLALVAALWFVTKSVTPSSVPAAATAVANIAAVPTDPAACVPAGAAAGPSFADAVAQRARREEALAQVAAFDAWLTSWRRADVAAQPALAAAGRELAVARRSALKHLIETDPRRALEAAMPPGLRGELPAEVQQELEQRIDTRANLDVLIGHGGGEARIERFVRIGDEVYRGFVFGRRERQQTKHGLPIHGIAIDGVMALTESPYQLLDDGEKSVLGHGSHQIVVRVGDQVRAVASGAELAELEKQLIAAESAPGPKVGQFSGSPGASSGPETAALTSPPSWVNGRKRVLWLKIDFSDNPGFPFSDAQIMANAESTADFFAANSQGKTTLAFSILPAVLRMPREKAYYNSSSSTFFELYNAARDAAKAYDVANGGTGAWDPEKADRYIVLHSQMSAYGYTGVNTMLGGPQVGLNNWLANTTAHELGHTQSLYHSHYWLPSGPSGVGPGVTAEYGDVFDRMGSSSSGPDNHFNVSQKTKLGYLEGASIATVTQSGTYRINRHDHRDASGVRALKIVPPGFDYDLWIEHRRAGPTALNAAQLDRLRNGVLLHWGTERAPKFATGLGPYLIDATPGSTSGASDAPLRTGETFIDPDGVTIKPLAAGGTAPNEYIDVQVTFGAGEGNRNPSLVAGVPAGPLQARTNIVFTASGSDPDGDPVYYKWDFGDGTFQPNLDNVTHRFTKGGKYTLRVSVHDGKGGIGLRSFDLDVADPLVTWTTRSNPSTQPLYDVVYGREFVAVGINSTVLRSTDGTTWAARPLPEFQHLYGIAFNGSRYVACGVSGTVTTDRGIAVYSDDGLSWQVASVPTGAATAMWKIAFGAGRFVMVGDRGTIMSSPDGITWTAANSGITNTLRNVSFGDGLFVATGDSGRILTSRDGQNWSNRSVPTPNGFYGLARHNGTWYTISPSSEAFVSTDGEIWTRVATAGRTFGSWSLRSLAGLLVSTEAGSAIALTEDPRNWVEHQIDAQQHPALYGAAAGNGLIVVVGSGGAIYSAAAPAPTSPPLFAPALRNEADTLKVSVGRRNDLALTGSGFTRYELYVSGVKVSEAPGTAKSIGWTPLNVGTYSLLLRGIGANGTTAVAAAVPAVAGLDGWDWRNPLPAGANLNSAVYVGGKWWIVGSTGTLFTLDASGNFSRVPFPTTQRLSSIAHANGRFVIGAYFFDSAARESIAPLWTSTDGESWTPLLNDQGYNLNTVLHAGGRWMAFSAGGSVFNSTDGFNWSRVSTGVAVSLQGAAFGNNVTVAVGSGGRILTSANGTTWTSRTSGVTTDLWGVAFHEGTFVAVGTGGVILTSTDGSAWTRQTSPVTTTLNGVGIVKGNFVIAGTAGVVLTSTNGTAWSSASIDGKFSDLLFATASGDNALLLGRAGEVFISNQPASWRRLTVGTGESKTGVTYAAGKFVAVGSTSDPITRGTVVPVQVSSDGLTWTRADANASLPSLSAITFGQQRYVAVGATYVGPDGFPNTADDCAAFTSNDGLTWTVSVTGAGVTQLNAICASPSRFVAAGNGGVLLSSPDGITWTRHTSNTAVTFRGAAYGNGRYVVVGDGGSIRHSADGLTWSATTSGVTAILLTAGWWEDVGFLVAGSTGTMLSSLDGIAWERVDTRVSDTINAITKTPIGYVASGGTSGGLIISVDGRSWEFTTIPADRTIRGLAASPSAIVAVGDQGALLNFGLGAASRPSIAGLPASGIVAQGGTVTLSVSGPTVAGATRIQWSKDGVVIPGATSANYTINGFASTHAGTYAAVVSTLTGSVTSLPSTLTLGLAGGRLSNLSIFTSLTGVTDNFTFGVVVGGAGTIGTKPLLVRAVGPSLAPLGVTGVLADPRLEFFTGSTVVGVNNNWGGAAAITAAMARVGAFALTGPASLDAALALPALASGGHSMLVSGTGSGAVIAELYDSSAPDAFTATTPRMINVSVLKDIGSGLTAGFVLAGDGPRTVLIRAIGPTLGAAPFSVPGVVSDPQLALFSGQTQLNANDNWAGASALSAAFAQVAAFALPPDSRDAALLATLQPGSYTVQVSGVGGATGIALIEVYEIPD